MAIKSILQDLLNGGVVDDAFTKMGNYAVEIAGVIAILAFATNVVYNFGKKQISQLGADKVDDIKVVDLDMLFRALVVFLMIGVYPTIGAFLTTTTNQINGMSAPKTTQNQKHATNVKEAYEELSNAQQESLIDDLKALKIDENAEVGDYSDANISNQDLIDYSKDKHSDNFIIGESMSNLEKLGAAIDYIANPSIWIVDIMIHLSALIMQVLRVVIQVVTSLLFKFLIAVGPMAFAFSLFPVFKNQINTWVSTTVNVGLVMTTINFIDHVAFAIMEQNELANSYVTETDTSVQGMASALEQGLFSVAIQCVLIGMYLSSFWLTSQFVGTGGGGTVMSSAGKAMGATAAIAAISASKTTSAVGKAGKSGINAIRGKGGDKGGDSGGKKSGKESSNSSSGRSGFSKVQAASRAGKSLSED